MTNSLHLPSLNAVLNSISALFLVAGLIFIKKKNILAHRLSMGTAAFCSTLFMISYLTYHYHHGSTRFMGEGWIRPVYFSILISHVILAIAIVPLVLLTLFYAIKHNFDRHKRIARWTWPLWMYVSVTGVWVYWMLYRV